MTRWKAAALHVLISAFAVSATVGLIIWTCYPDALIGPLGGWKLLGLVVAVDVVLGPLLTLIVFKPGKPSLKFDLAVIAALQLAALVYGTYAAWNSRPLFIVAQPSYFWVVFANEILPEQFANIRNPQLMPPTLGQPRIVGLRYDNPLEAMLAGAGHASDFNSPISTSRYVHYFDVAPAVAKTGTPDGPATVVIPVLSTRGEASAILSQDSGALIAFRPFPVEK